jgi:L,D-transpeptidase ErfK/SrfK
MKLRALVCFNIILTIVACNPAANEVKSDVSRNKEEMYDSTIVVEVPYFKIQYPVNGGHYLNFMDSLGRALTDSLQYCCDEYVLVHSNTWLLDSLRRQDYYIRKEDGEFVGDQKQLVVFRLGDSLRIPSKEQSEAIMSRLSRICIDVNIPEYKLRIYEGDIIVHEFPVRVGKNERKFLSLAGHEVDLRTPIGEGKIVRIARDPWYINPVDGHRYFSTRRDDGRYTALPRIPFLEPEIDHRRSGALIHPTTNRSTLGKAISNGCVGLSEADAWTVYYHAPLGTCVRFRYELAVRDSLGKEVMLEDIYTVE